LCAFYAPGALRALERAAADASLTTTVASLAPRVLPFADDTAFFNVNSPEDLERARALLLSRR
jgi:molybdopterin-guanine dinucleotide biosynthesis protein A